MTQDTHNKYFKNIDYNTDESVDWMSGGGPKLKGSDHPLLSSVSANVYDARIVHLIGRCKHARRVEDLVDVDGHLICVWINIDPDPEYNPPPFEPVAKFFGIIITTITIISISSLSLSGIWHEHKRGAHKGLHEFHYYSNYILLFNVSYSYYSHHHYHYHSLSISLSSSLSLSKSLSLRFTLELGRPSSPTCPRQRR